MGIMSILQELVLLVIVQPPAKPAPDQKEQNVQLAKTDTF
jgi:hypothetical protein